MNSAEGFAPPYGPPANVIAIIQKWRDHSLPDQVTPEWMEKIGLSPNLTALNLRALRFLGLVDEGGYPTDVARRLRTAPTGEYHEVFGQIVADAYKPILSVLNPVIATRTEIDDAFRHEKPEAQRSRMVAFFLGMLREAGVTTKEEPKGGRPPKIGARVRAVRSRPPSTRLNASVSVPESTFSAPEPTNDSLIALPPAKPLDPALVGIVAKIPELETLDDLESWITRTIPRKPVSARSVPRALSGSPAFPRAP